ncbi:MAG: GxxExxY protein [Opitutales bacterium]
MDADSSNRDPQTYSIIGAAMTVHSELGCGFLEAVYQNALAVEFRKRGIPFSKEVKIPVYYQGEDVEEYKADFICFNSVILELKALKKLSGVDEAQLMNYLKATQIQRGLLLNFGSTSLDHKRVIFSHQNKNLRPSA